MSHEAAQVQIQRLSRYAEPAPGGIELYEFWIASAEEASPGISESIRLVALSLLNTIDVKLLRSAIQALAMTGNPEDTGALASIQSRLTADLSDEVDAAKEPHVFRPVVRRAAHPIVLKDAGHFRAKLRKN